MPLKFIYLCDLLDGLETLVLKDPPLLPEHLKHDTQHTTITWLQGHRQRLNAQDTDSSAIMQMLHPERQTDRVYGLDASTLELIIARGLQLPRAHYQELQRWQQNGAKGGLACRVKGVIDNLKRERPRVKTNSDINVEDVDQALLHIAVFNSESSPEVRSLAPSWENSADPVKILGDLYAIISSREAKWLTRLILKDLTPVVVPDRLGLGANLSQLPNCIAVNVQFTQTPPSSAIRRNGTGVILGTGAQLPTNRHLPRTHSALLPASEDELSMRFQRASSLPQMTPSTPIPSTAKPPTSIPKLTPQSTHAPDVNTQSKGPEAEAVPSIKAVYLARSHTALLASTPSRGSRHHSRHSQTERRTSSNQATSPSSVTTSTPPLTALVGNGSRPVHSDPGILSTPKVSKNSSENLPPTPPTSSPLCSPNSPQKQQRRSSRKALRSVSTNLPSSQDHHSQPKPSQKSSSPPKTSGSKRRPSLTETTRSLKTCIFILSPCVSPIPYLTEELLHWHASKHQSLAFTSLSGLTHPSIPRRHHVSGNRYRRVVLVERNRKKQTEAFLEKVRKLDLKRRGVKEWLEVWDWRVVEGLSKVEKGENVGEGFWKEVWVGTI